MVIDLSPIATAGQPLDRREAGIPCHLRNLAARTLFHFFAPYIPVAVMVPAGRADEAIAVVGHTLER